MPAYCSSNHFRRGVLLDPCTIWVIDMIDHSTLLNHAKPLLKEFYNLGMAHAQTPEHLVLDAPARVGSGVFRKGVSMLTVVAAAQRHYEYSSKEQPQPIISAADMLRVATGELVLVPVDPTPKMIDATWDHDEEIQSMSHNARNEFIYKKMIEAQE